MNANSFEKGLRLPGDRWPRNVSWGERSVLQVRAEKMK